jgi:hypothetical protein
MSLPSETAPGQSAASRSDNLDGVSKFKLIQEETTETEVSKAVTASEAARRRLVKECDLYRESCRAREKLVREFHTLHPEDFTWDDMKSKYERQFPELSAEVDRRGEIVEQCEVDLRAAQSACDAVSGTRGTTVCAQSRALPYCICTC